MNSMTRRTLLKSVGSIMLVASVSRLAQAHEGNDFKVTEDALIVESGPGQLVTAEFAHHHHLLTIPLEILRNPPAEGVTLSTGWAKFQNPFANFGKHYHGVVLTYDQLVRVAQGEEVVVEDKVKDHKFVLRLKQNIFKWS